MQNNTTQEQWTRWEPAGAVSVEYDFVSIHDDNETGLTIIVCELKNKKKQLHFNWKYSAVAYKKTQERLTDAIIAYLHENYDISLYSDWTFFKINNSKYLKELSEQSGGLIDYNPGYIHFVFFTFDTLIDVITRHEPEIKIVNLP